MSNTLPKVFGIGMHKTATTSLDAAFKILGYNSAHFESPLWAWRVLREMKEYGRSLTLERHDALCDLPITTLYKELDRAYPGSKFILTVRSEDAWLKSVKSHFKKFGLWWHVTPYVDSIHKEVYGQAKFDEKIFRNRYKRHNEEVKRYFEKRPNDFLVMDMEKENGWLELCRFLNKPIPEHTPYPKKFVTAKSNGLISLCKETAKKMLKRESRRALRTIAPALPSSYAKKFDPN